MTTRNGDDRAIHDRRASTRPAVRPGRSRTAAEYLDVHGIGVALILAELAESAGIAGRAWVLALADAKTNPERALANLAIAEVQLHNIARNEVNDSLRRIRVAMEKFDRELPDDEVGPRGDDAVRR